MHTGSTRSVRVLPLRVLVVEDEPHARRALVELLVAMGHNCESAEDGDRAWAEHHRRPFDLILSDWVMPGRNGMELCHDVRRDDGANRHTYFLLMTAHADQQNLVTSLRDGADDFIKKPIDLDELEARLIAAERVVRLQRRLGAANRLLRRDSQRSFRAARSDALTRVGNRRQLDEELPRLYASAVRNSGRACIALCDVDHFKLYNDSFGHLVGDDALKSIAALVRHSLRSSDSVYRYGGEEFLAMLPDQSLDEATIAMNRVRQAVEGLELANPAAPHGRLTISVGIAAFEPSEGREKSWLERADRALYLAKSLGRNRCEASG